MINIYNLLNSIWIVPAVLVGIKNEIWKDINNDRKRTLINIWKELKLIDDVGNLTEVGNKIIEIQDLLLYFCNILPYHLDDDLKNIKKIKPSEYSLLRSGLQEYFNTFLSDIFIELNYKNNNWSVLDYGGGNGQYSIEFLKSNPNSKCLILDRVQQFKNTENLMFHELDFQENNINWWKEYSRKFDLVILSELLHCKNETWREYIINSSYEIINDSGRILICEKYPTPYFQWRLDLFTDKGECIEVEDMRKLISKFNLKESIFLDKKSHYLMEVKKI